MAARREHLVEGHVVGAGLVVEGAGVGVAHHSLAPPRQLRDLIRTPQPVDEIILRQEITNFSQSSSAVWRCQSLAKTLAHEATCQGHPARDTRILSHSFL